ncbi:MAG: DnaA/Hda family protein [Pseudomonadota bacterium]|nr:DnaA/Hda family protein [Pseudomonadota bacterium]
MAPQVSGEPTLAVRRVSNRLGRVAWVGAPRIDVGRSVAWSAAVDDIAVVLTRGEEVVSNLLVIIDEALPLLPWRQEVVALVRAAHRSGRFARVTEVGVDFEGAKPQIRRAQPASGLRGCAEPGAPLLVLIVTDTLAPGTTDGGLVALLDGLPGPAEVVVVHPWGPGRWNRTPLADLLPARPAPFLPGARTLAAGRIGLSAPQLNRLVPFARGMGARGLGGVRLERASATEEVAPPSDGEAFLEGLEHALPAVARQVLALAAAVPGNLDFSLLTALVGGGLTSREATPVDIAEALTSGLLERLGDPERPMLRFHEPQGDGHSLSRDAAFAWLPLEKAAAVIGFLVRQVEEDAGSLAGLGIPFQLLRSIQRGDPPPEGEVLTRTARHALRGLVDLGITVRPEVAAQLRDDAQFEPPGPNAGDVQRPNWKWPTLDIQRTSANEGKECTLRFWRGGRMEWSWTAGAAHDRPFQLPGALQKVLGDVAAGSLVIRTNWHDMDWETLVSVASTDTQQDEGVASVSLVRSRAPLDRVQQRELSIRYEGVWVAEEGSRSGQLPQRTRSEVSEELRRRTRGVSLLALDADECVATSDSEPGLDWKGARLPSLPLGHVARVVRDANGAAIVVLTGAFDQPGRWIDRLLAEGAAAVFIKHAWAGRSGERLVYPWLAPPFLSGLASLAPLSAEQVRNTGPNCVLYAHPDLEFNWEDTVPWSEAPPPAHIERVRVLVVGTGNRPADDREYAAADALGAMLARRGVELVSGGGAGVDEAVCRAFTAACPPGREAAQRVRLLDVNNDSLWAAGRQVGFQGRWDDAALEGVHLVITIGGREWGMTRRTAEDRGIPVLPCCWTGGASELPEGARARSAVGGPAGWLDVAEYSDSLLPHLLERLDAALEVLLPLEAPPLRGRTAGMAAYARAFERLFREGTVRLHHAPVLKWIGADSDPVAELTEAADALLARDFLAVHLAASDSDIELLSPMLALGRVHPRALARIRGIEGAYYLPPPTALLLALYELLSSYFSADGLRRFLEQWPEGRVVAEALPRKKAISVVAEVAAQTLAKLDLLGPELFDRLEEERPQHADAIAVVRQLWNSLPNVTQADVQKPVTVVILSAHADAKLRDILEARLAPLERAGFIGLPSQSGRGSFDVPEDAPVLFLFLVSPDFLGSGRCRAEASTAMRRLEDETARVIPILLRDCDWQGSEISSLRIVPARAIATYANRDEPWTEVVATIRAAVNPGSAKSEFWRSGIILDRYLTFETFSVGKSSEFAHAAAIAVADAPGRLHNPLFIYGPDSDTNTHLLHAVGNRIAARAGRTRVFCSTAERLSAALTRAKQTGTDRVFSEQFHSVDLLLLADVQLVSGLGSLGAKLFEVLQRMLSEGKQVVLTSEEAPRGIWGIEPRLRQCFESGLLADVQPPDVETQMAVLAMKASKLRLNIPVDVQYAIAQRAGNKLGYIDRFLHRLAALRLSDAEPITMAVIHERMGDLLQPPAAGPATDSVIRCVAEHYKLSVSDFGNARRSPDILYPRYIAMYLVRRLTSLTFDEIGRKFFRHGSTAQYGVRKIEKMAISNLELRDELVTLERRCRSFR